MWKMCVRLPGGGSRHSAKHQPAGMMDGSKFVMNSKRKRACEKRVKEHIGACSLDKLWWKFASYWGIFLMLTEEDQLRSEAGNSIFPIIVSMDSSSSAMSSRAPNQYSCLDVFITLFPHRREVLLLLSLCNMFVCI